MNDSSAPRRLPTVFHADLDAFFAAVEMRDRPTLRDRPVVVGGAGPRGVVATANYAARRLGIHSAQAGATARRLADGRTVFLAPRGAAYRAYSQQVMAVFDAVTPLVEPVSLDEAYLDVAAADTPPVSLDEVRAAATWIKTTVHDLLGLTVSLGCGTSKTVAKIASDAGKPDGLVVVPPGAEADFLADRPVGVLPGIGPVSQAHLERFGIRVVADLAAVDEDRAIELLGSSGPRLRRAAQGLDTSPVTLPSPAKSASIETTFDRDIADRTRLRTELDLLVARLASRLTASGVSATNVTVKIRLADFRTLTSATLLDAPTTDVTLLVNAARRALDRAAHRVDLAVGVRLLGAGAHLHHSAGSQPPLFTDDLPVPDAQPPTTQAETEADPGDTAPQWAPGTDVAHDTHGRGWVQGSGSGVVTVRFETRDSGPGPVHTLPADDPALHPTDPEPLAPLPVLGTWRDDEERSDAYP